MMIIIFIIHTCEASLYFLQNVDECTDEFEKVPNSSNTTYEPIAKNDTSIGDELITVKNQTAGGGGTRTNSGPKSWIIAVIVISSILVVLAIAFGIYSICYKDKEPLELKARPKSLEAEEDRKN